MNIVIGSILLAWLLYFCAFIVADVAELAREQLKCTGCQRHFVRPGCPIHDPDASQRLDAEAAPSTARAEPS